MPMTRIAGLWVSKDGRYLSGKLDAEGLKAITGTGRLQVWKNDKKEPGSKQPDYRVVFAPDDEQQAAPAPSGGAFWDGPVPSDGVNGDPF